MKLEIELAYTCPALGDPDTRPKIENGEFAAAVWQTRRFRSSKSYGPTVKLPSMAINGYGFTELNIKLL